MIPAKKRFQVLQRDNFRCQYCWKNGKDVSLEVDHVIPKSKWGTDDLKNLITCCRECNIWKWNEIIWDTKWIIRMKMKDAESETLKKFFNLWNEYGLWTMDPSNVAFVSWLIKSYFDRDTVIWYVEQCLVWKIWRLEGKWKLTEKDFYKWWSNCDLAINERKTFARENNFDYMIYRVKWGENGDEDGDYHTWLTDDYNKRLNWVISREIARIGKPMSLLYKYSLFPNMVETWQKEKEDF